MGSWDACCGLSKLSINVGDPVVDFLIAEVGSQRDRGFICYSNDLWSPLFVQSYGNYADYGVIEVEASWHTSYIERILRELVIELPLGENEHHDIEVTRDKITYDFAQNAIHEGRLMIPAPSWVKRRPTSGQQISRMMVHRFVFDDFVQHGFKSWQGAIDLPTLVAEGMQVVADIRKDRAEIAGSDDLAKLRREMQRLRRFATGHTPFVGSFRSNESGYLYTAHNFSSYKNLIEDSADSPDIEAIITELSKFILFRANMDSMQFLWSPQIGSQNDTDKDLSRFYATCERYIQERARLYREEWGDLDDDC